MRTTAFDRPMPEALARLRAAMLAAGDPEGLLMTTLSPEDAKAYIIKHDRRVVMLDGKTIAVLHSIHKAAIGAANETVVWGGPRSHDELVNAIIELEFPKIRAAREAYVQSVAG
jgi:hypothetical protein